MPGVALSGEGVPPEVRRPAPLTHWPTLGEWILGLCSYFPICKMGGVKDGMGPWLYNASNLVTSWGWRLLKVIWQNSVPLVTGLCSGDCLGETASVAPEADLGANPGCDVYLLGDLEQSTCSPWPHFAHL